MKFLIISGGNSVTVARDKSEAEVLKGQVSYDQVIDLATGPAHNVISLPSASSATATVAGGGANLNEQLDALESKLIFEALKATNNNQVQAARRLGITRGALQYKIKKYSTQVKQAA